MERTFISYPSPDRPHAQLIYDALKRWGHVPWMDVYDILPGTTSDGNRGWERAIHQGMKVSRVVCGILTPASLESQNVLDEWLWAIVNKRRLFILQFSDVDNEDIPPTYASIQRINFLNSPDQGLQELQATMGTPTLINPKYTAPQRRRRATYSETRQQIAEQKKKDEKNHREQLLVNVHQAWIAGVLEATLIDEDEITLDMSFQPNAVLRHQEYGDTTLTGAESLSDIFDDLGGEILILGAPGAGKTTTMLQLARELWKRGQEDTGQPIPAVFNLSSWNGEKTVYLPNAIRRIEEENIRGLNKIRKLLREPALVNPLYERQPMTFEEWLIDEFSMRYNVPPKVAERWLIERSIVLLLDGLDEVKAEERERFITAINDFRRRYAGLGIVVCSRTEEYAELSEVLDLQCAIELQPLQDDQLKNQLSDGALAELYKALQMNPRLLDLARTPFMLSILAYTYRNRPTNKLVSLNDADELIDRMLSDFIASRINDRASQPFNFQMIYQYLPWLAGKLQKAANTIFYLDKIDHSWLPPSQKRTLLQGALYGGFATDFFGTGIASLTVPLSVIGAFSGGLLVIPSGIGAALIYYSAGRYISQKVQMYVNKQILKALVEEGKMPENYTAFLDYCVDLKLMRKVGEGYIFMHRYLLEYFAARDTADPEEA